jgi:hypothetical protein
MFLLVLMVAEQRVKPAQTQEKGPPSALAEYFYGNHLRSITDIGYSLLNDYNPPLLAKPDNIAQIILKLISLNGQTNKNIRAQMGMYSTDNEDRDP